MMGTSDPQPSMFYPINLEPCVTADHPMRTGRPLIDTMMLRGNCLGRVVMVWRRGMLRCWSVLVRLEDQRLETRRHEEAFACHPGSPIGGRRPRSSDRDDGDGWSGARDDRCCPQGIHAGVPW